MDWNDIPSTPVEKVLPVDSLKILCFQYIVKRTFRHVREYNQFKTEQKYSAYESDEDENRHWNCRLNTKWRKFIPKVRKTFLI